MSVTVIAEIGINHFGNFDLAKEMVRLAKEAGADIAKFQWYKPEVILGKSSPFLKEATKAQFTKSQHWMMKQYCDELGIEWGVSLFHPEHVEFTESLGMKRYKVASRAALDKDLLKEIAATKKPVIASTGLLNERQIHQLSETFADSDLTLLYCVCKYPTELHDIHLDDMVALRQTGRPYGFSSHCPNVAPTLYAVSRGASVVENHVTADSNLPGCDIPSSIGFDDLAQMVKLIRGIEAMNGQAHTSHEVRASRVATRSA